MKEKMSVIYEFKLFTEKITYILKNKYSFEGVCIGFIDYKNNLIKIVEAIDFFSEIIFKFQFDSKNIIQEYFQDFKNVKHIDTNKILKKQINNKSDNLLLYPVIIGKETVGFLAAYKKRTETYSLFDIKTIKNYSNIISNIFTKSFIDIETANFSFRDSLTNLYNQDYFYEALNNEIENSALNNSELSVIMCELKDFMNYYEKYGETVANKLIIELSKLITEKLRKIDICTVFFGNIIAVISPDLSNQGARIKIDNIKTMIENNDFKILNNETIKVKVQFGLISFNGKEPTRSSVLIRNAVKSIGKI